MVIVIIITIIFDLMRWWILEYLASKKIVLTSESNLSLATGLASWKVSLQPGWLKVDSWLEIDLGSRMAHATLQLTTFDRIFLGLLPQSFKMNVPSPHQFIDFSFCIGSSQDLRGNFIRCKSHIVPNLIPRVSLLCLPWSLEERPWLWLVTWPPVTQTLSLG